MREADRKHLAKQILERAITERHALAKFGVTESQIERLQSALQEYGQAIAGSLISIPYKSTVLARLEQLFEMAGDLLKNELDRYALIARTDYPDFYSKYQTARLIKDLRGPILTNTSEDARSVVETIASSSSTKKEH